MLRPLRASLLIATLLLAACGEQADSPAAIVEGREIPMFAVRQELELLLRDPQYGDQVKGEDGDDVRRDFTRQLLSFLIRNELVTGYAAENDVTLTQEELDAQVEQAIAQAGGEAAFEELLRQRGLTIADAIRAIRRFALSQKVQDHLANARFGAQPTQEQREQAFNDWLQQRYASGSIVVNPRFGRLDPDQGQIFPITSTNDLPTNV